MKYKLLASDLDGTLLNEGKYVSRENIEIIKQLQEKEVHFTIATGRNYTNVTEIAKSIGISIPVITNDGALIIDLATGNSIYESRIDFETAKDVMKIFEKHDIGYAAHLISGTFLSRKFKLPFKYIKRFLKFDVDFFGRILYFLREMREFKVLETMRIIKKIKDKNDLPFKFSVYPNPMEKVRKVEAELNEKYSDILNVIVTNEGSMEIGLKGVSKATGLKMLEDYLNVSAEEVMVFGDNYNDVEMMHYAGFGVVMENAPDDLKKLADFVTDSNENHGVARAIEKFVLAPLTAKN